MRKFLWLLSVPVVIALLLIAGKVAPSGNHGKVMEWLKANVNDPSSLQVISEQSTREEVQGNFYDAIRIKIRTKNKAGALQVYDLFFLTYDDGTLGNEAWNLYILDH